MARPTPLLEIASSDPFMTDEEKEVLRQKKEAMDKLMSQAGLAKYKIEILFHKGFAPSKDSAGIVSFWESGSKFHGGGDTIMHICPENRVHTKAGKEGCGSFITDANHGYGFLICPKCQLVWDGEEVYGQVMARLGAKKWAQLVLKYYLRLDLNADIVIKYHPEDIRNAAAREQESQMMGDALRDVRRKRSRRIYPLKNIIKDTSAGAELEERFEAFIRA
jgi:hypothetical protein